MILRAGSLSVHFTESLKNVLLVMVREPRLFLAVCCAPHLRLRCLPCPLFLA